MSTPPIITATYTYHYRPPAAAAPPSNLDPDLDLDLDSATPCSSTPGTVSLTPVPTIFKHPVPSYPPPPPPPTSTTSPFGSPHPKTEALSSLHTALLSLQSELNTFFTKKMREESAARGEAVPADGEEEEEEEEEEEGEEEGEGEEKMELDERRAGGVGGKGGELQLGGGTGKKE